MKRVRYPCDWGLIVHREDPPCTFKAHRAGLCKRHLRMHKARTYYNVCTISSCEEPKDSFGDGFCTTHGVMNNREKCECCDNTVRAFNSKRCNDCITKRPCHKKGCKHSGTKDFYGRFYCRDHYPERKMCVHVTRERQCKGKCYGASGKCFKHGGFKKTKSNADSGRCCMMITLPVPQRCKLIATNSRTSFCYRHEPSNKCRVCDKRALIGIQQLCEDHVDKEDAHWCPVCKKGIIHKYYKCCQ